LRGWIHNDGLVTTDARQILITNVDKRSLAERVIAAGDVILGVVGRAFSAKPRTPPRHRWSCSCAATGTTRGRRAMRWWRKRW
jgi:hypothetical protein